MKYGKLIQRTGLAVTAVSLIAISSFSATASAASQMPISYNEWNGRQLEDGSFDHTRIIREQDHKAITLGYHSEGSWTSPEYRPSTPVNKIVASWQAQTPGQSWIETQLQVKLTTGQKSGWYTMGKWGFASTANPDGSITSPRGSVMGQEDATGSVDQDTYFANDDTFVQSYRVREVLHANGQDKPTVRQVAVTASDYTKNIETGTSATTMLGQVDLPVPMLSQYVHNNEYSQFDGGGAAWCSPTSVAMLLDYYHTGPSQQDIRDLPADPVFDTNHRVDGQVDYAAYHIFDNGYQLEDGHFDKNTGNWPYNVAYASKFGLDGSVRQYNSLRDVEGWIKKGVPVVVTLKWNNTDADTTNDLTGSSIPSTAGHLMVVRGFTANGDVIANDPATPSGDRDVRHVYNRAQFEHIWLKAKQGTVYIVKPYSVK